MKRAGPFTLPKQKRYFGLGKNAYVDIRVRRIPGGDCYYQTRIGRSGSTTHDRFFRNRIDALRNAARTTGFELVALKQYFDWDVWVRNWREEKLPQSYFQVLQK